MADWQAKIVTKINYFFGKKTKRKVLRIAWFGEKIDQNIFLFLFQRKVLKILWFGKKVDQNFLTIFSPPQTRAPKHFRSCRLGDERTVKRAQTGSKDPHRREWKLWTFLRPSLAAILFNELQDTPTQVLSIENLQSSSIESGESTENYVVAKSGGTPTLKSQPARTMLAAHVNTPKNSKLEDRIIFKFHT